MKTWQWTPLILIIVAAASYGLYVFLGPDPLPAGLIYGNGHIEGTEVAVSPEVTGRVTDVPIREGEPVAKGDVLVRIDGRDLRVALAEAEAAATAADRERARLVAELATAQHHEETAERNLTRQEQLRARGTIPTQRLEEVADAVAEAQGRVKVLQAAIAEAASRIEVAERRMDSIRLQLDKTVVRAPVGGTVLVKAIEAGELAMPGRPVAVLVDLFRLELRVFIPERDIGQVRLGAPVRVRVDAFPERQLPARVARIDPRAQFTPRDIHLPEERVRLVFGVTLALDNPEGILKPGMPADAWILGDPEADWPDRLRVPG